MKIVFHCASEDVNVSGTLLVAGGLEHKHKMIDVRDCRHNAHHHFSMQIHSNVVH